MVAALAGALLTTLVACIVCHVGMVDMAVLPTRGCGAKAPVLRTAASIRRPSTSTLPPASRAAEEAAAFAARAGALVQAQRSQPAGPQLAAAEPLPAGCVDHGTFVAVRMDSPPFETLAAATQRNKRGKRGATLSRLFDIRRGQQQVEVDVATLWATLRKHGGLHLVRAFRGWVHAGCRIMDQDLWCLLCLASAIRHCRSCCSSCPRIMRLCTELHSIQLIIPRAF